MFGVLGVSVRKLRLCNDIRLTIFATESGALRLAFDCASCTPECGGQNDRESNDGSYVTRL